MAHKALDVAHLILEKDMDLGQRPMTRLRLLKLTYITHGLFLGWHHRRLVREDVEAWKYGPVIYPVYTHFQNYPDGERIPAEQCTQEYWSDDSAGARKEKLQAEAGKFITKAVDDYANQTGRDISALTHQSGTPWDRTILPFAEAGFENLPQHLVIPAGYIESYYADFFKRDDG